MKTHLKIIACSVIVLSVTGCSNVNNGADDSRPVESASPKGQASVVDNESAQNILQVAASSADHTTLVAAVEAAQIEHILVNAGPLTVFAPNNAAFGKLPAGTVESLLKPENKKQLSTILTRHAAPGSYDPDALRGLAEKGRTIYMATGDYLAVTIEGGDVYVNGCQVIASIKTSNGIINVVDQVILPR